MKLFKLLWHYGWFNLHINKSKKYNDHSTVRNYHYEKAKYHHIKSPK